MKHHFVLLGVLLTVAQAALAASTDRLSTVMKVPGCVAFWDFVKREPDGAHRFTAHVPPGAKNADFLRTCQV